MGYNNPPLKINRPTKFPVPFDKMYSEWNCYLKGSRFMFCWGMITQHGSWTTTCLSPFSCNNSRNSFNKYWLMFFGEKLLYEFVFPFVLRWWQFLHVVFVNERIIVVSYCRLFSFFFLFVHLSVWLNLCLVVSWLFPCQLLRSYAQFVLFPL